MRVLVSGVVLGQPMGGVRRHNAELLPRVAKLLAEEGGTLAVMEGREPVAFPLPDSIERLSSDVPAGPPVRRAMHEGRALQRHVASGSFDLVHTGHLPVPRRLPVPYALTLHDLRDLALRHSPFWRRLFAVKVVGEGAKRAAVVIAVSATVRDELIERFELDPARVFVVPNAADHLPVLPREPAADAPLLHVGHLEPRKNIQLLVRTLAADPSLPDLQLVGAPKGDEDEQLKKLARNLGVRDRIRFLGTVSDDELQRLYARTACVVMPSRVEGFGIPVLEAQRARAPLAIAAAGAMPEVAGVSTPRFDPDDPKGCAAAIRAATARDGGDLEGDADRAGGFRWDDSAERLLAAWRAALA
ncbi:MAG: glycosyltransferase family 1 protein [Planctomycetota bacterium]|nr:glycosyltransferase family 1 protein [Planctomycetota bacterium]